MNHRDQPLLSELEESVEAYEAALEEFGSARITSFLPDRNHPDYMAVLQELVRVEMEHRFRRGEGISLEEYRDDFPELFDESAILQPLAFEEYRLRLQSRDRADPNEYARRYQVDISDWSVLQQQSISTDGNPSPAASADENLLQPGTCLLDFQIIGQLGRGAFAQVCLARQKTLANRLVVLKLSSARLQEAHRLARLQHTNIVPVYSVHQYGTWSVICMPFFGSTTLKHVVDLFPRERNALSTGTDLISTVTALDSKTLTSFDLPPHLASATHIPADTEQVAGISGPISPLAGLNQEQAALWIIRQTADGLRQAHARGILHRDLKPANILLTEEGQPMILDFNLAHDNSGPAGSQEVLVGGTLPYMSPEQISSVQSFRSVDERSDLFSLGVILFELLTGQLPYSAKGASLQQMIEDRWKKRPAVRAIRRQISRDTESIVHRCLSPSLEDRYQSASELIEDLDCQLHHLPLVHAANCSLSERMQKWFHRHPQLTSVSGILTVASVAVLFVVILWLKTDQKYQAVQARQWLTDFQQELPVVRSEAFATALGDSDRTHASEDISRILQQYARQSHSDPERLVRLTGMSERERNELQQQIRELRFLYERIVPAQGSSSPGSGVRPPSIDDKNSVGEKNDAEWEHYQQALDDVLKGHFNPAETALRELCLKHPDNFGEAFLYGLALRGNLKPEQAESIFTGCIALKPETAQTWYQRGVCRLATKDFSGAVEDFTRFLEYRPSSAAGRVNRALAFREMGELQQALSDLNEAISRGFPETRVYFLRADVQQQLGNLTEAEADRKIGMELEPQDARSWVVRGLQKLKDDPKAALADLQAAQKLDATSHEAFRNLAMVLSEHLNQPEEAIEVLDTAIHHHPEDPLLWSGRAVLHARAGRHEAARADCDIALKLSTKPIVEYQVACVYSLTSRQSPEDLQKAIRLLVKCFRADAQLARLAWSDSDMEPIRQTPEFRKLVAASEILAPGQPETR